MRTPNPPRSLGKAWLFRSIFILAVLAVVGAVVVLAARRSEPADVRSPGIASLPRARSGYQNRALRATPRGPSAEAPKAPKLHGTVYDVEGKAVPGARVAATTFQIAGNQSTVAAASESDSQGRFEMRLPDGTYYLSAEKQGYSPTIAVARGGEEVGLVLRRSGEVTGHVKDDHGAPIREFSIDVIAPGSDDMAAPAPFVSRQFESEDGSFRIAELPREGVFLRATAAGHAPALSPIVAVPEGKSQVVDLTLSTGCVLNGTVVDSDGTPLSDVLIDAELRRSAGVMGTTSIDAASQAESDQNGAFQLENVPLGSVMVRAYDGTHAVSAVEMTIDTCAALAPIKVEMSGGSSLSGVVKDSDGKPVSGARLTLSNRGTGFVETTADGAGRYRFEKLPPGGMRLEAIAGTQRAMLLVGVSSAAEVEQDITFPAEGKGEIRGRITANGSPLPGIQLTVISNSGSGMLASRNPVTAADGGYRVTGLRDGVYAVIVGSTGQVAQAKVDQGSTESVDLDVAVLPERGKVPERARPAERAAAPADSPPPEEEESAPEGAPN